MLLLPLRMSINPRVAGLGRRQVAARGELVVVVEPGTREHALTPMAKLGRVLDAKLAAGARGAAGECTVELGVCSTLIELVAGTGHLCKMHQ